MFHLGSVCYLINHLNICVEGQLKEDQSVLCNFQRIYGYEVYGACKGITVDCERGSVNKASSVRN